MQSNTLDDTPKFRLNRPIVQLPKPILPSPLQMFSMIIRSPPLLMSPKMKHQPVPPLRKIMKTLLLGR